MTNGEHLEHRLSVMETKLEHIDKMISEINESLKSGSNTDKDLKNQINANTTRSKIALWAVGAFGMVFSTVLALLKVLT